MNFYVWGTEKNPTGCCQVLLVVVWSRFWGFLLGFGGIYVGHWAETLKMIEK
jgi:hypothetical protein